MTTLYSDNHMTGGMHPAACYAPMKPRLFAARLRATLYSDNPATGGMQPAACYAPMKPRLFAARRASARETLLRLRAAREALLRLRGRQELYADTSTTGNRPPEECQAPLRRGKRRADEL